MQFAMISLSIICILIGIFPNVLYQMLPYDVNYIPYTFDHVFFQLQLLLFSGLAFFLMLKYLKRTLTLTLEFDWFWRKFSKILIKEFDIHAERTASNIMNKYIKIFDKTIKTLYKHHGPSGILGRTWPTGNMAFWTTVILASYLIIYLL
jgi:multicomponent Na+:H+ antiporter subunit D